MLMRYHCAYLSLRLPNTYSLSLVYDYPNSLGGVPSLISSRWPPVADYAGFSPTRCCYSAVNLCICVPPIPFTDSATYRDVRGYRYLSIVKKLIAIFAENLISSIYAAKINSISIMILIVLIITKL